MTDMDTEEMIRITIEYIPKTFGADGLDLRRNVVKLPDGRTTHEVSKPKPVVLILNPWLHKQYKMFGRELAD